MPGGLDPTIAELLDLLGEGDGDGGVLAGQARRFDVEDIIRAQHLSEFMLVGGGDLSAADEIHFFLVAVEIAPVHHGETVRLDQFVHHAGVDQIIRFLVFSDDLVDQQACTRIGEIEPRLVLFDLRRQAHDHAARAVFHAFDDVAFDKSAGLRADVALVGGQDPFAWLACLLRRANGR